MKLHLGKIEKLALIRREWRKAFDEVTTGEAFLKIAKGSITQAEYAALLRQSFHQFREHPQAFSRLASKLKGENRVMVKTMMRHAIFETGHEQLAADDLKVMDEDVTYLPIERPLPETAALLAMMYYFLDYQNPLSFLGYVFHLETAPKVMGTSLIQALTKAGIAREARTFIQGNAGVDIGQAPAAEDYIDALVQTQDDLESVIYGARVSTRIYGAMVSAAFQSAVTKPTYGFDRREMDLNFDLPSLVESARANAGLSHRAHSAKAQMSTGPAANE